ncbi:MAG TPA: 4-hydroxy-tetrahydrodipicolinate synthase [Planctomycetes bacterium]|nr:4-hydroxy-tetrahydrodipicolinate synthase [Planctomycetota bacterium]
MNPSGTRDTPIFSGSITALPTPFRDDSRRSIDYPALLGLIERQVGAGTDGLVVGGSTGEGSALSFDERVALFEYSAGAVRGRIPVIAGIGTSDTRIAVELASGAASAGVDALLATTPSYARPSQEGLVAHFAEVASATPLPIALYNIPSRTGVDLQPETVARIAREHPNVVAIKEASDSLERLRILIETTPVAVLCGEDRWIADALELGAAGVVGVASNLVPARIANLVALFGLGRRGAEPDPSKAPALMESVAPLVRALTLETNPTPLKSALAHLGLLEEVVRLPLVPVEASHRSRIRDVLEAVGVRA